MKIIDKIVNCILPQTCHACGRFSRDPICGECLQEIKYIGAAVCLKCGLPLPHSLSPGICPVCLNRHGKNTFFDCVRGVCLYEGRLKVLINSFKYGKKDYLAKPLGSIMETGFLAHPFLTQSDIIVPVPLHWRKKFVRGFNQSELLARRLSLKTGIPLEISGLKRRTYTAPQAKLSRNNRLENVKNAFSAEKTPLFASKTVLLIDDVSTTCETINQCARVLKECGAATVFALTLARDA